MRGVKDEYLWVSRVCAMESVKVGCVCNEECVGRVSGSVRVCKEMNSAMFVLDTLNTHTLNTQW